MARNLIAIARTAAPARTLTAHTLLRRNASASILEKLGFKFLVTLDYPQNGQVWERHFAPN
jgi:hypothetical protein